jgi:hypothetical protein
MLIEATTFNVRPPERIESAEVAVLGSYSNRGGTPERSVIVNVNIDGKPIAKRARLKMSAGDARLLAERLLSVASEVEKEGQMPAPEVMQPRSGKSANERIADDLDRLSTPLAGWEEHAVQAAIAALRSK